VLREATRSVLAEHVLAVCDDVEDPAAPLDQLGLDSGFSLDGVRQTGGFGKVVSFSAVGDADVHGCTCSSMRLAFGDCCRPVPDVAGL
jgi:hypothetical protein